MFAGTDGHEQHDGAACLAFSCLARLCAVAIAIKISFTGPPLRAELFYRTSSSVGLPEDRSEELTCFLAREGLGV